VNGVHDLGGMHGFGPVVREENEPVFHEEWERRMFALQMIARRPYNVDELRRTIERMEPARYLAASYYERWLYAVESLLIEKGILRREEIEAAAEKIRVGKAAQAPAPGSAPTANGGLESKPAPWLAKSARPGGAVKLRFDPSFKAGFKTGQRVMARNINPEGHTRIPRYARGHRGVIRHDWGVFVFPDTHAHGQGANPEHCYSVEFTARELWGEEHPKNERVLVDLWESYLEAERITAADGSERAGSKKAAVTQRRARASKGRAAVSARMKKAPAKARLARVGAAKAKGAPAGKSAKRARRTR